MGRSERQLQQIPLMGIILFHIFRVVTFNRFQVRTGRGHHMVASSLHSKVEQSYVKDCADSLPRSKLYFVSWTWEPLGDLLKQMHSQPREEAQRLEVLMSSIITIGYWSWIIFRFWKATGYISDIAYICDMRSCTKCENKHNTATGSWWRDYITTIWMDYYSLQFWRFWNPGFWLAEPI